VRAASRRNAHAKRLRERMTNVSVIGRNIMIDGVGRISGAFERNSAFAFYEKIQKNHGKYNSAQ
jgi:hypothetical protein